MVRPTRERIEELERQRNTANGKLEAARREIGELKRRLAGVERERSYYFLRLDQAGLVSSGEMNS